MNWLKRNAFVLLFITVVVFFFKPFLFEGRLPIPSDTIIGLYHPFRDLYAKNYPNGIPFKNFLITDPVRQQYPWRELAIDLLKKKELPLWNPYAMAGYPLLGNQQSAVFYPFNILFLFLPFSLAWSLLIFLEPFLAGIFLYAYLRNLHLRKEASLLGSISFAFSGFSIAWLEWGTILHCALWLPLLLLSIDKIFSVSQDNSKLQLKIKNYLWPAIFILSLSSSFFAGHLQTFFYVFLASLAYLLVRWWQYGKNVKQLALFAVCYLLFVVITAVQWIPTLQLISESARNVDQADWQKPGWFIPWQHIVQFIAPDFFGNPTTLNYWGVWNYGEFVGYIGIFPLIFAISAVLFRKDRKTIFFGFVLLVSLLFSLPTPLAKIPFILNIPFLATAQPTRLLFVADFALAILSALGFDYILRERKNITHSVRIVAVCFLGFWLFVLIGGPSIGLVSKEALVVAKSNLILPSSLFIIAAFSFVGLAIFSKRHKIAWTIYTIIIAVTIIDLLRFGFKFTPFTSQSYLFPPTQIISFLQNKEGQFRIMTTDDRILPPNFSTVYRIQTVDGYDPLYLRRYGELIAASERGKPNISTPFGFNRIITPHNYDSKIIDLLGVRYILSLSELSSPKLTKVFQEGQTRVYENKNALPRAFFVEQTYYVVDKQEAIEALFRDELDLQKVAIIEVVQSRNPNKMTKMQAPLHVLDAKRSIGIARIISYSENRVEVEVDNPEDGGFLIITDTYYPIWKANIDNDYELPIGRVDYMFRGVSVPKGKHTISMFIESLL